MSVAGSSEIETSRTLRSIAGPSPLCKRPKIADIGEQMVVQVVNTKLTATTWSANSSRIRTG